jgi:ABC-type branched-subunit amino acid transport system ATPase component
MREPAPPADGPKPTLRVRDLHSGYGAGGDIIRGVSLDVAPGSIMAVIGPNGSGKSTFAKTLAGLLPPRRGTISLTGTDVTALDAPRRVAEDLAYVPQERNVFPSLTVRENLSLATEFMRKRARGRPSRETLATSLFPDVLTRSKTLAGNLSGGQRQMLAFACAMLADPDLLLLDEPSAGLSPRFASRTMQAVERVRASGVTVVLVEQNVQAALGVANSVLVMVAGQVRLLADPSTIKAADLARLFFSGTSPS